MFKRVALLSLTLIGICYLTAVSFSKTWEDLTSGLNKGESKYEIMFSTSHIGHYKIEVEAIEVPSKETLPTDVVDESYFPKISDYVVTELDNLPPDAWYDKRLVSKVDVVFAIGKYSQSGTLMNYTKTIEAMLNNPSNNIDARVQTIESAFESEFALHTTWDTISDMDTHIYLYSDTGQELEHIWYGHKEGTALRLDYDDTRGGNSHLEDSVAVNVGSGQGNGEWFTIDFPNLPENAASMKFVIEAYRGTSDRCVVTLVDKLKSEVVTKSTTSLHTVKQRVTIGELRKNSSDGWDFIKASGEVFQGTSCAPLGETINDVDWRDGSKRFIINISEEIPDEVRNTSSSDFLYTAAKLSGTNAYLINVGNNTNRYYLDKYIQAIKHADGSISGEHFNYTSSVPNTFNPITNRIIEMCRVTWDASQDWILVGTEVKWDTHYTDSERDLPLNFGEHDGTKKQPQDRNDYNLIPSYTNSMTHLYKDTKVEAERWRYRHYYTFFDNYTIREAYHGQWVPDPVEVFNSTGKFRINYKRKDNPYNPDTSLTNLFNEYRYWSAHYDRKD